MPREASGTVKDSAEPGAGVGRRREGGEGSGGGRRAGGIEEVAGAALGFVGLPVLALAGDAAARGEKKKKEGKKREMK